MKIGVIGSGAWGTAIANICASNGNPTLILSRHENIVNSINREKMNNDFFPGILLSDNLKASSSYEELNACDYIFLVTPAQTTRLVLEKIDPKNKNFIICSKGIEEKTLKLISSILNEYGIRDEKIAVLSGPNLAHEVVQKLPAVTTIASVNSDLYQAVITLMNNAKFRCYQSEDIIGVQLIGAFKNVLAIAAGIAIGKNLGENAKSAIITRGIAEAWRLMQFFGGKLETLISPAGIGDINLTCNSEKSRNFSFGMQVGKGEDIDQLLAQKVIEGYYSTSSVYELSQKHNIDMPITDALYKILRERRNLDQVIGTLLTRNNKNKI